MQPIGTLAVPTKVRVKDVFGFWRADKAHPARMIIPIHPYGQILHVLIGATGEDVAAYYNSVASNPHPINADDCELKTANARFIWDDEGQCDVIAFKTTKPTPEVISHEVMHFIQTFKDRTGLAGREAEAYLMGWLVGIIYDVTRGKTIYL